MSPFATCSLKAGGSISLSMLSGLTVLIFWFSLSGRQLTSAPESTSASTDRLLKSIGAKSILRFFFRLMAEKIGMHFSLVSGSVITISFSCLLVWIQSSSCSGMCSCLVGLCVPVGDPSVSELVFALWLNSLVSVRLTRRVRGFAVNVVASVGSPASFLLAEYSWVEYWCSGLCGLEGDDVIAARISLEVAGSFLGDSWSTGGGWSLCLSIDLREVVGGVTITVISVSCSSSACSSGVWLVSSFLFGVVEMSMLVLVMNS